MTDPDVSNLGRPRKSRARCRSRIKVDLTTQAGARAAVQTVADAIARGRIGGRAAETLVRAIGYALREFELDRQHEADAASPVTPTPTRLVELPPLRSS